MEMNQIRYFVALCEERSFTRAAERCGVTQPSLSRAIKRLEVHFGGALFERGRKRTIPSALGMALLPHLKTIDEAAEAAMRAAKLAGPTQGGPPHEREVPKRLRGTSTATDDWFSTNLERIRRSRTAAASS